MFKEVLDGYKGKPFYSNYQNELIKHKKNFKEDIKDKKMPKSKATLINELVNSKLPYICLYLPNVLIDNTMKKKMIMK